MLTTFNCTNCGATLMPNENVLCICQNQPVPEPSAITLKAGETKMANFDICDFPPDDLTRFKITVSTEGTKDGNPFVVHSMVDRDQYDLDLRRRQKKHLEQVKQIKDLYWRPCLHDQCPDCVGTGIKKDGSICVHNISCPCPKCTLYC